ncbi:hypothetical protein RhiirA5_435180 [Rhizophagus irregularis]|uniref:Uncharacterized protein n=1 Tax=Rhizophagus irregularis TaxID=588596 RepID=A0A2N0NNU4_9GLOM|nr:hypothetical protein RhiirA5_435180 [Rhizophagus irregularis]
MIMEKSSWIPGGSPNLYRFLSLVFIKVERQLCLIEFLVSMYECNIRSLGTKKLSKNGIHYEDGSQSLKNHLFQQIFLRIKVFHTPFKSLKDNSLEILHHIVNRYTEVMNTQNTAELTAPENSSLETSIHAPASGFISSHSPADPSSTTRAPSIGDKLTLNEARSYH